MGRVPKRDEEPKTKTRQANAARPAALRVGAGSGLPVFDAQNFECQRSDYPAAKVRQQMDPQVCCFDELHDGNADCHRRVECAARNAADSVSHHHYGKADGQPVIP
jgi:hypothetical protein